MKKKKISLMFRFIKGALRVFYPETEILGAENITETPSIIVGNHTQMHGPIVCELYFPIERVTWCAGELMHFKEVHEYAYRDFWSQKPKFTRPFYKLLSHIIAPLSVCVFNNANTIGVYHDTRILSTFRNTVSTLQEGTSVVIFPEHDVKFNNIIYDFQDKFIDVAKFYHKKTGNDISFVPLYIAPALKKAYLGKPIKFCYETPIEEERARICKYLMQEITDIATSLPCHTVVPYRNIPKKMYPKNIQNEVRVNEETCS